jgi:cytochrome o ubiquinol oxidase subunit III
MNEQEAIVHERHNGPKVTLGFWMYLMTDCVLFATLFATYAVLKSGTAGGPSSEDLFDIWFVLGETLILLTSSFTCGMAILASQNRQKQQVMAWLLVTALLGAAFLGMELSEFSHLVNEGNSWQRSGFLSAFFTLVGTHGLHITAGLIWIITMIYRINQRGLTQSTLRKLTMLSLFWHFLDVIWIFIFTIVYMIGVL